MAAENQPNEMGRKKRKVYILLFTALLAALVVRFTVEHRRATDSSNVMFLGDHEAFNVLQDEIATVAPAARISLLLQKLNSPSAAMRYAAIDALEDEKGQVVESAVEVCLHDSSAEIRKRALDIMPKINRSLGYRMLLSALIDEDDWVRIHAIEQISTLSRMKGTFIDRSAVPVLIETMSDPDQNVPALSFPVLKRLTGNTWKFSPLDIASKQKAVEAKWKDWWKAAGNGWADKPLANIVPILQTRADNAPEFSVSDINGEVLNLKALRGKVILLNFWGTWCGPCQAEVPDIVRVYAELHGQGLTVIGDAQKESSTDTLRAYCIKHDIKYNITLDRNGLEKPFGNIDELPVSILIDKQGKIRRRWDGERDYETFKGAIQKLLKE